MILSFDEFELDTENLELRRDGEPMKSDAQLLRTLAVLAGRAGQLVTKQDLVRGVWGGGVVTDNAVTVTIARLRKLLDHAREKREFIVTVHGRGYRFVRPVGRSAPQLVPSRELPRHPPNRPPFVGRDRY